MPTSKGQSNRSQPTSFHRTAPFTAEDLFVLAAQTGIDNVTVILSPVDFRLRDLPKDTPTMPDWTQDLYGAIRQELKIYESQQFVDPYVAHER